MPSVGKDTDETLPLWHDVISDAVTGRGLYECEEPEEAPSFEDSQSAALEDSQPTAAAAAAVEDSQPIMAAPVEPMASPGEDSQPVEVEDSQPLTATVLEEDCRQTELDSLPPVFDDAQPRPETELDELPSVPEREVPCTQPDPPLETEDGEDKTKDEPTTPKATTNQVPKKPAAKRSAKPTAIKTKAEPRQTGASQKEQGDNVENESEDLKDLPMVTREHQQAIKTQKDKTKKMDDAREASRGEPKGRGRGRGRGRGIAKRPASRKPAKGKKQPRLASPVEAPVFVDSESEGTDGEECKKDLTSDFEAAADKSAKLPAKTEDQVDTNKGKPDKRKRPSTKDDASKGKAARKVARKVKEPKENEPKEKKPKEKKPKEKEPEPKEAECEKGTQRKATFAGRYCPARDGIASARFLVIRKVFEEKIERMLTGSVSSFEAGPKSKSICFTPLMTTDPAVTAQHSVSVSNVLQVLHDQISPALAAVEMVELRFR